MRVAVLMSSYNGEKYIREQIDSILAQQGDFECHLWVRDDGSTDHTQEILKNYADEGKLSWYTGENLGPAKSFLNLLAHDTGYDCYAFTDQDDYWMPDKLDTGIKALKNENNAALYFSNAELVDSELRSLGRKVYKAVPKTDLFTLSCAGGLLGCTMILNRKLAQLAVSTDWKNSNMVMHDFFVALLCAAVDGKILYDSNAYMKYRQHESNVVGVAYGKWGTLKSRIKDIRTKSKISIADQAESILKTGYVKACYSDWLYRVSKYQKSLFSRIGLACSGKTEYIDKNMSIKLRLSILLGNR